MTSTAIGLGQRRDDLDLGEETTEAMRSENALSHAKLGGLSKYLNLKLDRMLMSKQSIDYRATMNHMHEYLHDRKREAIDNPRVKLGFNPNEKPEDSLKKLSTRIVSRRTSNGGRSTRAESVATGRA